MHEYSFISIPLRRTRAGTEPASDYQDVIREQAISGWTFVQAISFDAATKPHLDLIFTREVAR